MIGGGGNGDWKAMTGTTRALNHLKGAFHDRRDDVHGSFTPLLALTPRKAWSLYDSDRKPTQYDVQFEVRNVDPDIARTEAVRKCLVNTGWGKPQSRSFPARTYHGLASRMFDVALPEI
jgi:hypothetical protein